MQSSVFIDCAESRCLQSQRLSSDYGIQREGNVGIALRASKFPSSGGWDDDVLFSHGLVGGWWGVAPKGKSMGPQFFSRGCVKGAYLEIPGSSGKYQATCRDRGATKIFSTGDGMPTLSQYFMLS
jgi:hypothetical protein